MTSFASEVSLTQSQEFISRFGRLGGTMQLFKKLMSDDDLMRAWIASLKRPGDGYPVTRLDIPMDLTAEQLLVGVQAEFRRVDIPFKYFDGLNALRRIGSDLEAVRGKTCKVLVRKHSGLWHSASAIEFQQSHGFDGNTAAFLLWVMKTKPLGHAYTLSNEMFRFAARFSQDYLEATLFVAEDDNNHRYPDSSAVSFSVI